MTKRDKKWGESWSNNQYLKRFLNRIQGYISDLLMDNLFIFYRLFCARFFYLVNEMLFMNYNYICM